MPLIDSILMELEQEAPATRKLLERVPEPKLSWKPHPKSFSLGQLALHVAQVPGSVSTMAAQDAFELPQFHQPEAGSRAELLSAFEQGLAAARNNLSAMDDKMMTVPWSVLRNGKAIMTLPRIGMLRVLLLNHYYHHRGQLTVYLRLLDVPLPSVYGPSADENPFA